jgi:Fur family peroxide stress response transcriptional regulator
LTEELETRVLEMKGAMEARGVALTPRRSKLLEILVASDRHPSVAEIHEEITRHFPGASLATVYNTIELLKEAGQVLEIAFSGAANRYDGRRPLSHPHVICLECERIEDGDLAEPDMPLDAAEAATGYKLVNRRTDYYGVCPACQKSGSRSS